jgi:hypothetical protein
MTESKDDACISRCPGRATRRTALRGLAGLATGVIAARSTYDHAFALDAHTALTAFKASTKKGLWPQVNKSQLIDGLAARVNNPCLVNQGRRSLCGPAAIVHELAKRRKLVYVQMARALYETGYYDGGSNEITPSHSLLTSKVPSSLNPADWLMLASLRDDKNTFYVVEYEDDPGSFEEGISGLTTPGDMEDWTRDVLGFGNVVWDSTYVYGENDALRSAQRAINGGGVAFLMIDTAMLGGNAPTIAYPKHWVSFKGDLSIDEGDWWCWDCGHVAFKVYSWGNCSKPVNLGEGPFEDYMWGAVTGR